MAERRLHHPAALGRAGEVAGLRDRDDIPQLLRPYLEQSAAATPLFITLVLMVYGAGGAAGNFAAGSTVSRNPRRGFIIGCAGLVVSLTLLLTIARGPMGSIATLIVWGISFGVVQLSQVTMTQAAAPDTFEAAMSLNTMAYNTSIALGALFGGLFVDHLGSPASSGTAWR